MRQDKDRGGKWLLTHHGDAVLRLGGFTDFTSWKPLAAETVAPRRLPDGLLEVRFPDRAEPVLVLVEIETYPDPDADRQVLDDLMLIAVDRNVVPEVVSLVLKPKGKLNVTGVAERTSRRGRTRLGGSWPVVRLWELDAEELLASPDAGVVPWVPLARTALQPDEVMARCRDRLNAVADERDRAGLIAVTSILAKLAFPTSDFTALFGGTGMFNKVILDAYNESPVLRKQMNEIVAREFGAEIQAEVRAKIQAEIQAEMRIEGQMEAFRSAIVSALEARFGRVAADSITPLNEITDEARLRALLRLAVTCPDLDAFVAGLTATP